VKLLVQHNGDFRLVGKYFGRIMAMEQGELGSCYKWQVGHLKLQNLGSNLNRKIRENRQKRDVNDSFHVITVRCKDFKTGESGKDK
jgi:hypothetical protein